MDRIMLAAAIGTALVFSLGVVLGVIVMVSMASNEGPARHADPAAAGCASPRGRG